MNQANASIRASADTAAAGSRIAAVAATRKVYVICPWGSHGGGMYRVADYLFQGLPAIKGMPPMEIIDARGSSLMRSPLAMLSALTRLTGGRISGRIALVHIHMAERLSVFRKGALLAWSRALGLPVVLHLHAGQFPQSYARMPGPLKWLTRQIFRLPTYTIVLGGTAYRYVIDVLGADASKVIEVANGVPRAALPRVPRKEGEAFRILFLGNLSERKGVSDLLNALSDPRLKSLPWTATLAGGGDVDGYKAKAEHLGLGGRIRFTGWLGREDAAAELARADTLVLPSYDEGLPLVILEALTNRVPVVCTPVGEIPLFLRTGKEALMVEPGQPGAIAEALAGLIENPDRASQLAAAGNALYERTFALERFAESVAAVYRRCGLELGDDIPNCHDE